MKLTPYERVVTFENFNPQISRPILSRSKNGCFNCRKRKKKCDEKKPKCTTCSSKRLECVWPKDSKDKLPSSFKISKPSRHSKSLSLVSFDKSDIAPCQKKAQVIKGRPVETTQLVLRDKIVSLNGEREDLDYDYSLDTENRPIVRSGNNLPLEYLTQFTHDREQQFFFACANGFIEAIGPQYTHPLLTTSATFTPWINRNDIMRKVASACGCAYLSWQNPALAPLSIKKYQTALAALETFLLSDEPERSSNWMGAAFQMMCMCTRSTNHLSPKNAVLNLAHSYKIIKSRFTNREKPPGQIINYSKFPATQIDNADNLFFSEFDTENLKMEIENSIVEIDNSKSSHFDSHFERMFVESFIYNYGVAILVSESHKYLPNPFEVFRDLRQFLKTPMFRCDVAWMNNPVFGASLDSFELAAKAAYLIKKIHDPLMLVTAKKLYDMANFYPSPMIPSDIRVDCQKYKELKESVLVAEIYAKTAKIILKKLIIIDINEDDPELQKDLNAILTKFQGLSPTSKVNVILCFPAFIAGTVCINDDQRDVIANVMRNSSARTHGQHVKSAFHALRISWGESPDSEEIKSRGMDILFDKRIMSRVLL